MGSPGWAIDYGYYPLAHANEGKLASIESTKDNVKLDFGYDGALLTTVSWSGTGFPGGGPLDLVHGYDNGFRMTSEQVGSEPAIAFAYADLDGLLTSAGALTLHRDPETGILGGGPLVAGYESATTITDGTGTVTDSLAVNPFGELASYTALHGTNVLYDASYERDALGRIERKSETIQSVTTHYGYQYDLNGRLTHVYEGSAPCNPLSACTLVEQHSYDPNGNRDPGTCSYDDQDRLLSCGSTTYQYTDWGALKEKSEPSGTTYYEYDLLGNLRKVTTPTDIIEYVIDGLGRRVGRKINSVFDRGWIYRDALNPVAEIDATGAVQAVFVYGTKPHVPDYMVKNGSVYRFITDHLGSVRLVVKVSDGSVAQRIDYNAWGNATLLQGTWDVQSFGFAGGPYDQITELIRFGARDYEPKLGRWLTRDPILFGGRQLNLHLYVNGDPVNWIDPSGLVLSDCVARRISLNPFNWFNEQAAWAYSFADEMVAQGDYFGGGAWYAIGGFADVFPTVAELLTSVGIGAAIGPRPKLGGSGRPITPTVKHASRKLALDAAAAESAKGQSPVHHPAKNGQPRHFHPVDSKGNLLPKHHDYP